MAQRTIGYHIVISGYGLWLPGDDRGSWSEAWDEKIGFIEPHILHAGDPVRKRMAEERMRHPPVRLTDEMIGAIIATIGRCEQQSSWSIAAASIEPTHLHILITYTQRNIDGTIKWLKQRMTRAVHETTSHRGPVWAKGAWRSFIFEQSHWVNAIEYIENHNQRRGEGRRPHGLVTET